MMGLKQRYRAFERAYLTFDKHSQEKVRTVFDYDERDPSRPLILRGRAPVSGPPVSRGSRVGAPNSKGYWRISIRQKTYYIHQLVWVWHHGFLPETVDHADRCQANNVIGNLREATMTDQLHNRVMPQRVGRFRGVQRSSANSFRVQFYHNGRRIRGGSYPTEELAARAYDVLAQAWHGRFAILNFPGQLEESKAIAGPLIAATGCEIPREITPACYLDG